MPGDCEWHVHISLCVKHEYIYKCIDMKQLLLNNSRDTCYQLNIITFNSCLRVWRVEVRGIQY